METFISNYHIDFKYNKSITGGIQFPTRYNKNFRGYTRTLVRKTKFVVVASGIPGKFVESSKIKIKIKDFERFKDAYEWQYNEYSLGVIWC